jgi:hypothetical protein
MDSLITQALIDKVLVLIQEHTCFIRESMSFEIQDDFQFLLISISVDQFGSDEISDAMKHVANLLYGFMPKRKGDYSWMVNFKRDGEIIESYFGGDVDSPDSGMPCQNL